VLRKLPHGLHYKVEFDKLQLTVHVSMSYDIEEEGL